MASKYRVSFNSITKHQIDKETDKTITYMVRKADFLRTEREFKISDFHSWHDTFDKAKQSIIESLNNQIEYHNNQIEFLQEKLTKANLLIDHD